MDNLEFYTSSKQDHDVKRIFKQCFGHAHIPFVMIVPKQKDQYCQLLGVKDNGKTVAFMHLIRHKDITYVLFLGVDQDLRSNGYGSRCLEYVKTLNPRIALNMEIVNPKARNYAQRQKRERFYQNNDFEYTNITFGYGTNNTALLHYGTAPTLSEFDEINKKFIGKFLYSFARLFVKCKSPTKQ